MNNYIRYTPEGTQQILIDSEWHSLNRTDPEDANVLYTSWAVLHLRTIDECLRKLASHSNTDLWDCAAALSGEKVKLILTNSNYLEAHRMLMSLNLTVSSDIVQDKRSYS